MTRKTLKAAALSILACTCLAGSAMAETQLTPEMRQKAFAVARVCRTDLATYCKGVERGEGRIAACLKDNAEKLSSPCRSALADIRQQ